MSLVLALLLSSLQEWSMPARCVGAVLLQAFVLLHSRSTLCFNCHSAFKVVPWETVTIFKTVGLNTSILRSRSAREALGSHLLSAVSETPQVRLRWCPSTGRHPALQALYTITLWSEKIPPVAGPKHLLPTDLSRCHSLACWESFLGLLSLFEGKLH